MIITAFIVIYFIGPHELKKLTCFRSKIGERMSGPSGMGKPAFMPASVRNQQVSMLKCWKIEIWRALFFSQN